MKKTILKLHANGDVETINTPIIQSENGIYSFSENSITIPKIIEYPPEHLENHFIEKTLVKGWTTGDYVVPETVNNDRVTDFINVDGWAHWTVRLEHVNLGSLKPEFRVLMYDSNKEFQYLLHDNVFNQTLIDGVLTFTLSHELNDYHKFIRLSINHYGNPNVITKVTVNKGITSNNKHYLSSEDMPYWVRDTGHPISIFSEGIVIKGELI